MRAVPARLRGLLILAAIIAVLPLFLSNNFHYDVAVMIGFNAIVCVGLNLLIGYTGHAGPLFRGMRTPGWVLGTEPETVGHRRRGFGSA